MKRLVAAAMLAAVCAAPASAKDWPSIDHWDFIEYSDSCEMATGYDGPGATQFSVMIDKQDKAMLGALNGDWQLVPDRTYDLAYSIEEGKVGSVKVSAIADGGQNGFIANADQKFFQDMFKAGFLQFAIRDASVSDDLDLSGSDRAYAQLLQCLKELKAKG